MLPGSVCCTVGRRNPGIETDREPVIADFFGQCGEWDMGGDDEWVRECVPPGFWKGLRGCARDHGLTLEGPQTGFLLELYGRFGKIGKINDGFGSSPGASSVSGIERGWRVIC